MTNIDAAVPMNGSRLCQGRAAKRSGSSGTRTLLRGVGTLHRLLYRWSGGRLGGKLRGGPVLLLTTTGRKTGQERTWPLSYVANGDDLVLVASAGGALRHPAWYLNLRANPRVSIQVGGKAQAMVARTAYGVERARLWERAVRRYPVVCGYQRRTSRELPIVVLQPAITMDGQPRGYAEIQRRR